MASPMVMRFSCGLLHDKSFVLIRKSATTLKYIGQLALVPSEKVLRKHEVHTSTLVRQTAAAAEVKRESKHWLNERIISIALLGLIPAGVLYPSPPVDWAIAVVLPLHNYWGVNQVLIDYVHGKTLPKIARVTWLGVSVLTVVGLGYINYADVGICKLITSTLRL